MYIVFDTDNNFDAVRSKYLLLELDTVEINNDRKVKSYCVIDRDHLELNELSHIDAKIRIHQALIRNYHQRNWTFCLEAIDKLLGSFKGEVDSFYEILRDRINELKTHNLSDSWTGNLQSTTNSITPRFV
jgi:hypothetical protein